VLRAEASRLRFKKKRTKQLQKVQAAEFERLLAKERSDAKMTKTDALIDAKKELNEGRRKLAVNFLFQLQTKRRAAQKTIAWEASSHSTTLYGTDGISILPPPDPTAAQLKRFSSAGELPG
jgi:hypothetical protein